MLLLLLLLLACLCGGEEWAVKLESHVDPTLFAQQQGFVYKGPVDFLPPGYYMFEGSAHRKRSLTPREGVLYARMQKPRYFRTRVADPLYSEQWHLHSHLHGVDADLVYPPLNGSGVTIAVVDDGVQHRHPDLMRRYDAVHSWDFNDNDSDPSPTRSEQAHGTAAAGVAVAERDNAVCGSGPAYGAKLVGIRLIAGGVTDYVQAQGLRHNAIANVDIFSCSWGPMDDGATTEGPDALTEETLAWYTNGGRGRLGKGTVYVWASGNGRADGDSCAFDGFAGSMYVNAIGAIDHTGNRSYYSEGCAALIAVTPSSGSSRGITTIDLMGNAGYSATDCTSTFGGTSSAAPLASGLIALVLQARPDLTWRDVKHVLARGATLVDPMDRDLTPSANSRGFRHSYGYGFGILKAPKLIQAAKDHKLVPHNMTTIRTPTEAFSARFPFTHVFNLTGHILEFIEHVQLTVQMDHPRIGAVEVTLTSPEGTVCVMQPRRVRDYSTTFEGMGWTFTSVRFWGERIPAPTGASWTVHATEAVPSHGILTGLQLSIHGY